MERDRWNFNSIIINGRVSNFLDPIIRTLNVVNNFNSCFLVLDYDPKELLSEDDIKKFKYINDPQKLLSQLMMKWYRSVI